MAFELEAAADTASYSQWLGQQCLSGNWQPVWTANEKLRISLFVSALDQNPIVRAKPIADALLSLGFDVEVLGLLLQSDGVYQPYRHDFDYITLTAHGSIVDVVRKSRDLSEMATGDVVYAFKPLPTSFLPGLMYSRFGSGCPIFLDVEDDDVFSFAPHGVRSLARVAFKGWRKPTDYKYSIWLNRFVGRCSGITVSSTRLQSLYGGRIVLHGPGPPSRNIEIGSAEQLELRNKLAIPPGRIAMLFSGVARPHKGFDLLIAAAESRYIRETCHIVLGGDPDQPLFRQTKKVFGENCTLLGTIASDRMKEVVQACDLVPVLQNREPYTESQIPGKMLEAFACSRPVLATDVGDLPALVGAAPLPPRGWVLKSRSVTELERVLSTIERNRLRALQEAGKAANAFYVANCSTDAIAGRLSGVFHASGIERHLRHAAAG